jgi:NitT/TauT family transport system substrate-binding protein
MGGCMRQRRLGAVARGLLWLAAWSLLAGCEPLAQPTTAPGAGSEAPIRVTFLATTDAIPFFVAEEEGYFATAGVNTAAVVVNSAAERETLIQSRSADCELTDIHSVVLTNARDAEPLRIIATARQAAATQPLFFLLSAPNSPIRTADQLAGANIGIAENTIIEYWHDRVLTAAGVDVGSTARTNVPQIAVRLELLLNNQLDAAILPDPLASLAQLQGAHRVVDDAILPAASVSVLACRADIIAARPDAIQAFLVGWDQAVKAINAAPADYQEILVANARVPEPLQVGYTLPPFAVHYLPDAAQVMDVVDWALEKGAIGAALTYEELVDPSFRE